MPSTSSDEECHCKKIDKRKKWKLRDFIWSNLKSRSQRKRRRKSSCERDEEDLYNFFRKLHTPVSKGNSSHTLTSFDEASECDLFYKPSSNAFFLNGLPSSTSPYIKSVKRNRQFTSEDINFTEETRTCWIHKLPEEILLLIFSYLPLAMLLLIIPHVCKSWEKLAMDWTLWKSVEHLRIKSMVVATSEVKNLLRIIPRLKNLELILRNDTEELLEALFQSSDHLEVLRLDRCSPTGVTLNMSPSIVRTMLESCPKLKSITVTNTYFRSRNFYRYLAQKFRSFERINISCTTKSEMDLFIDNLRSNVPGVEFQRVSMMGKADGKQIYWGPILGLVIRPNPTSPYHRQHNNNEFPNYAF